MSIQDEINARCGEEPPRLFLLPPAIPGSPCVRHVFVSPEINGAAQGPWDDADHEFRCGRLRQYLDRLTEGMLVSVGRDPFKKKADAFLVRLDEAEDEVWEIRVRQPKPGIRIFGRFADKDVFVALSWLGREVLTNDKEWRDARENCKATWRKLFPTYPAHTGDDFDKYISNFILV